MEDLVEIIEYIILHRNRKLLTIGRQQGLTPYVNITAYLSRVSTDYLILKAQNEQDIKSMTQENVGVLQKAGVTA